MPRPTQGHVIERLWSDGDGQLRRVGQRAYGRYEKSTFGTDKQGGTGPGADS